MLDKNFAKKERILSNIIYMRIVEEDSTTTRAMFERIDACLKRTC